ncbi:glycosyltransferase family 4 protein [Alkalilimnicola ehrlichii]|uniref:glycosyltransferase family 4 protein n=1 Tax=Alkalilimnicola ehrlichii TaxID=351052 RepID=UPI003BA18126
MTHINPGIAQPERQGNPLGGSHVAYLLESGEAIGENVRQQMQAVRAQGARLTLICMSGDATNAVPGQDCDDIIRMGLPARSLQGSRLRPIIGLRQLLRRGFDCDTLVCDQYKATSVAIIATSFRATASPRIVALLRGYYAMSSRSRRRFYRAFQHRLGGVITLTQAQKQHFLSLAPWLRPEIFHVVPNYLDYQGLRATMLPMSQAREELGLPEDAFVIGCIARFDRYKRIEDLAQAFPLVLNEIPQAHLALIGTGRTEQAVKEQVAKMGMSERVTFYGHKPGAFRYLRGFDVFAFPSVGDNFARVLLEAMAAEVPIVAADCAGTPEVVGSCAILVPGKSPQALANAVCSFHRLGHQEKRNVARTAYRFMTGQHTRERLTDALTTALGK